jgi:murein DD-endopeptidase MepM/ murein hydrolase activator NlpD
MPHTTTLFFVVSTGDTINVREKPSVNAAIVDKLPFGEQLNIDTTDPQNTKEQDGWVWYGYQGNWVAERKVDRSVVNLLTVPQIKTLFEVLPVDLAKLTHLYYYGNTVFAYCHGREHNYDGYSQGLHGGLDFGHPGGLEICAGVTGTYQNTSRQFFPPNCTRVKTPDGYTILYGHIDKPNPELKEGDPVTPSTPIGIIASDQQHLHLEVRYRHDDYIVNPLLLMSEDFSKDIMRRFKTQGAFSFFEDANWSRWQEPFDQPIIRHNGKVIGPTAGKENFELKAHSACH